MKKYLCTATADDLKDMLEKAGEPAFRAVQIMRWVYRQLTDNPLEMKNIPIPLREKTREEFVCQSSIAEEIKESPDGTKKILIRLSDGEAVEAVIIPSPERITFCLSSQVGCPVGCRFCASGSAGLVRNLRAGEIIEEFMLCCQEAGKQPDNIVFMGIGEGLMNFDNLAEALDTLSNPEKIGMSPRRITVSTSGFTQGIKKLAALGKQFNLAISLHAPDDKTRASLIPEKVREPIGKILEACDFYQEKTGRMPTLEYTLLKGINDSTDAASKLARIALKHHAKINLIPYNQTDNPSFQRPERTVLEEFEKTLIKNKVHVTIRIEKGSSAHAACGQLRIQRNKETNK